MFNPEGEVGSGIFLGLTTIDIFSYVSNYPSSNEKIRAKDQLIFAGGPATNAAVAYTVLGNKTKLVSALGELPLADIAKADLKFHGVELIDLAANPQQLPVLSSITIDESNGDRSVVYTDTTDRKLKDEHLSGSLLEGVSVLMLDGFYLPHAIQLAEQAKEHEIPVVLDGGSWKQGIEQLLPLVDYAICSANFFPPGCRTRDEVVRFLSNIGVSSIAISQGGTPLHAWQDGEEKEIAVESVTIIDTLGAGDILHGAFCHFIQSSYFFNSLKRASEIATQSCRFKGTRAWIKSPGE